MKQSAATFAVVGAVNHGKSSVVATLAENAQVRISSMPGETVDCQRFYLADLFVFIDTPGFQNAHEALPELESAENTARPLDVFDLFIRKHDDNPAFEAECRLFRPLVEGAGVLYVVDGSEPVRPLNLAEMRILRLTGAPRLAVINRTGKDDHVADWKRRLGMHFNAVREFDAHRALFADRVELLETLAGIEQSWKLSLTHAISALRDDWNRRISDCAEILVELIRDTLTYRESRDANHMTGDAATKAGEKLRERYLIKLADIEARAHRKLIRVFNHDLVGHESGAEGLLSDDLFSDETWSAFGLNEAQLMFAATTGGAVGGAAIGAKIDVGTGGSSWGFGTVIGGAVGAGAGAAGAWWAGKEKPIIKFKLPREIPLIPKEWQAVRISTRELTVGPCKAINFPWVLLDRALITFAYVSTRSHARRDQAKLRPQEMKSALDAAGLAASSWDNGIRREVEDLFKKVRSGEFTADDRTALRENLVPKLRETASNGLSLSAGPE